MTKLADFENRAIANTRARHIAGAKMDLSAIVSNAQHMQRELDDGYVPHAQLAQYVTQLNARLAALECLDEVKGILDSDLGLKALRERLEASLEGPVVRFMPQVQNTSGEWYDALGTSGMESADDAERYAMDAPCPVHVVRREIREEVVFQNGVA